MSDLQIEDISDDFFDRQDRARTDTDTPISALVGLGVLATGLGFGALAAKRAISAKKERERIQKEEIARMEAELAAIKKKKI